MGLVIKKKIVKEENKPINPKEVAKQRLETLDEEIYKSGVPKLAPSEMGGILNIDSTYLTLPKDLTEIPSKQLGNFLNAFTQQKAYMRTLIGWQEICVEGAKRVYFDKYVPIYTELSKQKMSETSKELIVNNDPEVKEVFINYKDEKQKLNMLSYSIASIEDSIFLISREISRRGADFNTESRNDKYNV